MKRRSLHIRNREVDPDGQLDHQCQDHRKCDRLEVKQKDCKYKRDRQGIDPTVILCDRFFQIPGTCQVACDPGLIAIIFLADLINFVQFFCSSLFGFLSAYSHYKTAVIL